MIEVSILSAASLLLLPIALSGMAIVAYFTYSFPGRIFQVLLLATAAVSIISTLLTGRVLRLGDSGLEMFQEGGMGSTLLGKGLLLALAGVAFSICVAWGLWRLGSKLPSFRYPSRGISALNQLSWSFVIYFVAFSLVPLAFAPRFQFHVSLVYPLFVWLALLLALRTCTTDPVLVIRQALGMIVLTSLAAAVLMPALALQPGYSSLIPGFNMRLWGTTASANTLGSVAGTLLVMQFIDKPRRNRLHHAITVCTLLALILSQSKTAMGGALLGLSVLFAWRIWRGSQLHAKSSWARLMGGTVILLFLAATLVVVVWLALTEPTFMQEIERRLDTRAVGGLSTLSGRTDIWDFAVRRGMESLWFGHGLSMWDLQTRFATGLSGAVHAHNLYLQTFSRSGLLGLTTLLVLLAIVVRFSLRAGPLTAGGSLALLTMFLVRSVTEVPLQPNGILGAEFFAFMALLVYSTDRGMLVQREILIKENNSMPELPTVEPTIWGRRGLAPDSRRRSQ